MEWMAQHGTKRTRPAELVAGTHRIIIGRMDYWPPDIVKAEAVLDDANKAYISRYALGRDYHKVLRKRLQKLSTKIEKAIGPFGSSVVSTVAETTITGADVSLNLSYSEGKM